MGKISDIASDPPDGSSEHQTMAESFAELGWEVLRLGTAVDASPQVEIDFALAHVGIGVALVDLMRPHHEPVDRLRARLDAVGFSDMFPGYLPIIHRVLGIDDLWRLSLALDPGFASQPPMEIAGREWIGLVQRALLLVPTAAARPVQETAIPVEPASAPPDASDAPSSALEPDPASLPEAEPAEFVPIPPEVSESLEETEPPRAQTEEPLEAPPACAAAAPQPESSRSGRHAWWVLLTAGVAAAIGLSHQFSLPEGPAGGGRNIGDASTEGPPVVQLSRESIAEQVPTPAIPLIEARITLPRADVIAPLPEEEAPLLDLFAPVSVVSSAPPGPRGLPAMEEVPLLPARLIAAQAAPEEIATLPRIAAAPAPEAAESARMANPPPNPPEPQIAPETAASGTGPMEALVPLPDPAAATDAQPAPHPPIEAERATTPPPERAVTAFPPAEERAVTAVPPAAAPTLPTAVIEMLIARGDEMLARGDISGARLFYARAASAGSAAAARAMAQSFEADVLNRLGVRGIRPDPEQARQWHQRAEELR